MPAQKRRVVRLHCSYDITFETDGKPHRATVLDMGLQGMRLEVPLRVDVGSYVSVCYEGARICYEVDTVRARVVWARPREGERYELGLAYADPGYVIEQSWVRYLLCVFNLEGRSILDRRRNVRVKAMLTGALHPEGSETDAIPVTVFDLGLGGALFEVPAELPLGTAVRIEARPFNENRQSLVCEGEVVRTRRSANSGHFYAAVRFVGNEPNHGEKIGQFVGGLLDELNGQQTA